MLPPGIPGDSSGRHRRGRRHYGHKVVTEVNFNAQLGSDACFALIRKRSCEQFDFL